MKPPTVKHKFTMGNRNNPDSVRYIPQHSLGTTIIEDTDEDLPTKLKTKDAVNYSEYVHIKEEPPVLRKRINLKEIIPK